MNKGKLTPRSNNTVGDMLFTGAFGQPDGFGSVLTTEVKVDGRLVLTLDYRVHGKEREIIWSIELDNAQRNVLAQFIGQYQPRLYERIE